MVYAIDLTDPNQNPIAHISTIGSVVNVILPIAYIGSAMLFLGMLIIGGFIYIQSEGNPEKLKKAQQLLMSAILGLAVVLGSYLLVKLIAVIFGYTIYI